MRATNVLLYHLAMLYCTTLSSEIPSKDESSQAVEKKAPADGGPFLKIKQESDISVEDAEFEASYFQNRKCFNRALSKLNERKDLTFEEKINLINTFIKTCPRDKEVFFIPQIPVQYVGDLYNKLYNSGIIACLFRNDQPDSRFLNSVIDQGKKKQLFDRSDDTRFPYSDVKEELFCLLYESRRDLRKVKNGVTNRLILDQIEHSLVSNEKAIRNSIGQINLKAKLMYEFVEKHDGEITEKIFETPEFREFFSDLSKINDQFRESFRKYAAEYKNLYAIDDEKIKEFLAVNSKVTYYISSAFEAIVSMNTFLINLQILHTKQAEVFEGNIFTNNWSKIPLLGRFKIPFSSSKPPTNAPADYILSDLASNLAIHLLDNSDAVFQQLETGNFSVPSKTAVPADNDTELNKSLEDTDQKPTTANPEDAVSKPKVSQDNGNQQKVINGKAPEESKNTGIFPSVNVFTKFIIAASMLVIISSLLGVFGIIWLFSLLEKFMIGN